MNKIKSMYDLIKKQNGEAFAQAIRRFDSGIFDIPNLDKVVKFAGRNAMPILSFLSGLRHNLKKKEKVISSKTPFELLKEAGYEAFYADSLEKQNLIEPYFVDGEALCTFSDKKRYIDHHIIHCVKRGAEKLKRSDFKNPKREDEYGVSVISIQILKKGGFVKITNRYNHAVENPDNTFGSNPDNIVLGLTFALERQFKMKLNCFKKLLVFVNRHLLAGNHKYACKDYEHCAAKNEPHCAHSTCFRKNGSGAVDNRLDNLTGYYAFFNFAVNQVGKSRFVCFFVVGSANGEEKIIHLVVAVGYNNFY